MFTQRANKSIKSSTGSSERLDKPLHNKERLAQRLYKLDRSSTGFPEQLNELLRNGKWAEYLEALPQGELEKLIGYLDKVRFISTSAKSCLPSSQILDSLDRTGSPFREGLHLLQEICSSRAIFPATYEVTSELSLGTTKLPFGGANYIYKGTLGKADVCVKRFPPYWGGDYFAADRQVSYPHDLWPDFHTLTGFGGFPQGGCGVEIPQPPEYCAFQGCCPQTPPTRVRMDARWASE